MHLEERKLRIIKKYWHDSFVCRAQPEEILQIDPIQCNNSRQALAIDIYGAKSIVNAVCPNEVDTPMLRTGFAARGLDPMSAVGELNRTVPLGRVAQPEDIADVVLFLASDQSRYMCGALLEVNGGKAVG